MVTPRVYFVGIMDCFGAGQIDLLGYNVVYIPVSDMTFILILC